MILPGTGRGTAPEGRGGGGWPLRKPAVYTARKLRRAMSPPEVLLWSNLRGAKMGFKVRRQHPIGPYVVDFFVSSAGLVVEVDGSPHEFGDRPERDAVRERYLTDRGFRVLRLVAREVLYHLESVLRQIAAQAATPLHHQAARDGPPPRAGEDSE